MKKIIIANWKCNPTTLKEAQKMFLGLKTGIKNNKAEAVVCPPFVYLQEAKRILGASSFARSKASFGGLALGSQNCFWENSGAFTGEVSPKMLKDLGIKYVILGHSERRIIMDESTEQVNKKIKAALKAGLIPVVCFGELLEEKQQGKSFTSIEKELKEMIGKVSKEDIAKIIFAYEPDWAISSNEGLFCSPDDALTMALYIKKLVGEIYGKKAKENIKVLYGGNVTSSNTSSYLENPAIDGLLVGGASLNTKEFLSIIHTI